MTVNTLDNPKENNTPLYNVCITFWCKPFGIMTKTEFKLQIIFFQAVDIWRAIRDVIPHRYIYVVFTLEMRTYIGTLN